MILEKVIKKIDIQSDYRPFVEKYTASLLEAFNGKIHSIYMCGSIPKGCAKPFKSDADFTIICDLPGEIDYNRLNYIKEQVLLEYPLVTKIDTIICSMDEVLNKPHEWGFWIKIICVCIYGIDLGQEIPPILISTEFVLDLNNDTEYEVKRVRDCLLSAKDPAMQSRYIKGYSKRLLRALYSLVLKDTEVWQDDILDMKNAIIRYSEIDGRLIEYLYACYLDTAVDIEEFLGITEHVYCDFERTLQALAVSR